MRGELCCVDRMLMLYVVRSGGENSSYEESRKNSKEMAVRKRRGTHDGEDWRV